MGNDHGHPTPRKRDPRNAETQTEAAVALFENGMGAVCESDDGGGETVSAEEEDDLTVAYMAGVESGKDKERVRLEAECAAMRLIVQQFVDALEMNGLTLHHHVGPGLREALLAAKDALSTDAGRELLERLRKAEDALNSPDLDFDYVLRERDQLRAELEQCKQKISTARGLLDDSFNGVAAEWLYDEQGVNQAHRVLAGGFSPRQTKTEGGI